LNAPATDSGGSRRRSLLIWTLFCVIAGITFLAYVFASLAGGRGELLMPLDDAYIHFQYARQLAAGQPYVYNPGLPPSSGATSFLYPYLLAIGYVIGFQGLNLGLWAMAIGALALVASSWLVYLLSRQYDAPEWMAVLLAVLFSLTGPVSWHFMSGMETGLAVLLTLLTLYMVVRQSLRGVVAAASLLALIRPEGGILTLLTMAVLLLQSRRVSPSLRVRGGGWGEGLIGLVPFLAIAAQPLVNLSFTGSPIASGSAAKSLFGIVPPYLDVILARIVENFLRMWLEFATSTSTREGLYLAYPIALLAVVSMVSLLRQPEKRLTGLLVLGWLLASTLAVATLDTAFWHFKRYQLPLIALFFPLAAWEGAALWQIADSQRVKKAAAYTLSGLMLALTLWTGAQFLHHYALNAHYIYLQPLQMARWLDANTPPASVVAVHDTGLIRYLGGRATIDMVGLTTPGAAAYWRNGPGAVAEFLMQERPDYIASYGHGHGLGLGMLADTSLYGEPLASFPVVLDDRYNVALAAAQQAIYRPTREAIERGNTSLQPYNFNYWANGSLGSAEIDVADLASEARANYRWHNSERLPGFPTEVRELDYVSCAIEDCLVADGGRLINGEEWFDLDTFYDSGSAWNVILVTRVHPVYAGTFDVYANDVLVGTRWIPAVPGNWLEIATFIPEDVATDPTRIRIVPHVRNGYYMPYYHWAYSMDSVTPIPENVQSTYQNGAIALASTALDLRPNTSQVAVNFDWYTPGTAQGDYIVFVHLYNQAGELVAQADERPGDGTLPPGNWLPGMIHDTMEVDVSDVPPGSYRVAIGLYNPVTLERLPPDSGGDADNRLFIGEVEIPPHG
jgi:hypothetical protein